LLHSQQVETTLQCPTAHQSSGLCVDAATNRLVPFHCCVRQHFQITLCFLLMAQNPRTKSTYRRRQSGLWRRSECLQRRGESKFYAQECALAQVLLALEWIRSSFPSDVMKSSWSRASSWLRALSRSIKIDAAIETTKHPRPPRSSFLIFI